MTTATIPTSADQVTLSPGQLFARAFAADPHGAEVLFDYTITDGSLLTTGHVSVTVTPVNDAPVAVNDTLSATEDTALVVTAIEEFWLSIALLPPE